MLTPWSLAEWEGYGNAHIDLDAEMRIADVEGFALTFNLSRDVQPELMLSQYTVTDQKVKGRANWPAPLEERVKLHSAELKKMRARMEELQRGSNTIKP